ncbi:MAG: hypothetical protein CSA34_07915 [Desulfobulbus propionicus]|nr:MAG: hypothetical protein CSA34_07915 [Desulfobulbus propionicus]
MTAKEIGKYATGLFQQVIDQCDGCERVVEHEKSRYCATYVDPAAKWRLGMCNFATHARPELNVVAVRVNPLKAAKRASRRK